VAVVSRQLKSRTPALQTSVKIMGLGIY
jgi:hypothetical protein